MTPDLLAKATEAKIADANKYCQPLIEAMDRFEIQSPNQRAAFIGGTIAIESTHLSKVEEDLYYKDPQYLANTYKRVFSGNPDRARPYTRNSKALGDLLYQGFWGRGLIQLTWRKNYELAGTYLGFDYVANPDLLTEPWHAAMTAGWYWNDRACNRPADRGDMDRVTELVNGPAKMHLAKRKAGFALALNVGV